MFHQTLARTLFRAAVIAAFFAGYPCLNSTAIAAGGAPLPAREKRVPPANAAASVDFPAMVERYGPAVVNITAHAAEQQTLGPTPDAIDSDDPFFAFFKRAAPQSQESQGSPPRAMSGTGSGFIVSPDGLILTTAHVVDRSDEVTVRLTDRREFKAQVLVVDAQSDVAVLQIDATKLPTVKLGDSSRVRVGEQTLTIGSPDSFQNTVTAGIVSATSRTLPDGSNFPFFQTDVAVNLDNSGGPLFNRAGEVVGIDVQIYADAERYRSLTFAIPINLANKVLAQLQTRRNVSGGSLGMEVQDVGPGLAVALGLPRPAGALVNSVEPGTPAAASGLKPGDVIVQIGDKTIDRSAELVEDAADLQTGTKITLKLIRNRKPMTISVMAGASGETPGARQNEDGAADRLGLIIHPLSEDERRASGLAVGLMVDGVSGPAASAGIQPGDIILSLNDTLVESQEQVATLEAKAGKVIAVLIQRHNARSFVSVKLR
ncbi:trypsin-like peptidase domain-containing protein [Caballeronia mineralivorans]|uniref:trypsin-like peptidase domain-containing protein n=1 Tax=Caballeronia mineralivorans TaxID=2010198 RepID=UPI002B15CC8E|nr:serine protease Do [Caballeronia mineralivorans]